MKKNASSCGIYNLGYQLYVVSVALSVTLCAILCHEPRPFYARI